MQLVSNLMFWISNGLLVPVIVGLLYFFLKSLFMLGGFYNQYMSRNRQQKQFRHYLQGLNEDNVAGLAEEIRDARPTPFVEAVRSLLASGGSEAHNNRTISEYELNADAELGKVKTLTKFGPILGLMGTLIPMGPALVGLSTGDIGSMAYNMQVAFATTVLGLFAGAVGYILLQVKQRWVYADISSLDFISSLLIVHRQKTQGHATQTAE